MSRLNIQNKTEGHRFEGPSNRDLQQKLTYQQLLNLNHDLTKENHQLKSIGNRLGQELKNLHSQFEIKPREENAELYHAIGNHPVLHHYELTLLPLLDAYEVKIQEFETGFETINEEFNNLEKKYEDVAAQNQRLKVKMTDKIKQIIELYRNGSSEKLGSDFGQIILQQINQKQKYLVEENFRLQREYKKYKPELDRSTEQLAAFKKRDQQNKSKINQFEISHKQLDTELKNLKENIFNAQMKTNELQNEKKKLQKDIERALSQVNQLNRESDSLHKNYDSLKIRYQKDINVPYDNDSNKVIDELKNKLAILQTRHDIPDDSHKKLNKVQKDYDIILKQKNQLKDQVETYKIKLEQAQEHAFELKKKIDHIQTQKMEIELSEAKLKKSLEQLAEKCKTDLAKMRKLSQEACQKIEENFNGKVQSKQRKVSELEDSLDKIRLQRDKLQKENIIHSTLNKEGGKPYKSKDAERVADKLKQKLAINQQLFKQQQQIVQNDNVYLRKEAESYKNQAKEKSQDLRKMRQELQKTKKELSEVSQQKSILIEEIKRVRNQYEGNLKDKERLFDQKIRQIKAVVEQSDKRRKVERQKVAETSRQYKRVLQEIKSTYEERIRVLEVENANYNSKSKKIDTY